MKWLLVYMFWDGSTLLTEQINIHETMEQCFVEREALASDLGGEQGYYPINHQAICVKIEN